MSFLLFGFLSTIHYAQSESKKCTRDDLGKTVTLFDVSGQHDKECIGIECRAHPWFLEILCIKDGKKDHLCRMCGRHSWPTALRAIIAPEIAVSSSLWTWTIGSYHNVFQKFSDAEGTK